MVDMGVWNENIWSWNIHFIENSEVYSIDQELTKLLTFLEDVAPDPKMSEIFEWLMDDSDRYTVNSCYNSLSLEQKENEIDAEVIVALSLLWKSKISSNFQIFAWRIFLDRFSSKDQLYKRGFLMAVEI